jgi:tRNA(Ile)-lysidine synthase
MTTPARASAARNLPGPALNARFLAALNAVWPECARTSDSRLGVAVSGGPDSTALLLLAAAALPGCVEAATVDHGLRPQGGEEAAAVAALSAGLDVPHATLRVEVAAGNVQAQARKARYAALAKWMEERGLAALATAHHADDQAETLLLRLNRASGVAGLAGARERGPVPGTRLLLLRPLLDWRRAELARIVADAGIVPADDPSNADDRFDRARIRRAIGAADWLDVDAIAASARHLADADLALDWAAAREWEAGVRTEALGIVYRPRAPRAVALRVIARIVAQLDGGSVRGGAIAKLFDALVEGRPGSIGNLVARPAPGGWSFAAAPRRRASPPDH